MPTPLEVMNLKHYREDKARARSFAIETLTSILEDEKPAALSGGAQGQVNIFARRAVLETLRAMAPEYAAIVDGLLRVEHSRFDDEVADCYATIAQDAEDLKCEAIARIAEDGEWAR